MNHSNDIPEEPLEVQSRAKIPVDGKTAAILELEPKKKVNAGLAAYHAQQKALKAQKAAMSGKSKSAAAYVPKENPRAGMPRQQIEEICGRHYTGAPKMNPDLGDLDPAFRAWLWTNHPQDAEVRYFLR